MKFSELLWLGGYGFIGGFNLWSGVYSFIKGDVWEGIIFTFIAMIFAFLLFWLAWMRYQDKEMEVLSAQTDQRRLLVEASESDQPLLILKRDDAQWWERWRRGSRIFPWSKIK